MKKTKRILALIGAILLLLLYVVAFVATVLDHTSDMRYWKAAVAATIIIPVPVSYTHLDNFSDTLSQTTHP